MLRRGDAIDTLGKVEIGLGPGSLALGVVALVLAETAGATVSSGEAVRRSQWYSSRIFTRSTSSMARARTWRAAVTSGGGARRIMGQAPLACRDLRPYESGPDGANLRASGRCLEASTDD